MKKLLATFLAASIGLCAWARPCEGRAASSGKRIVLEGPSARATGVQKPLWYHLVPQRRTTSLRVALITGPDFGESDVQANFFHLMQAGIEVWALGDGRAPLNGSGLSAFLRAVAQDKTPTLVVAMLHGIAKAEAFDGSLLTMTTEAQGDDATQEVKHTRFMGARSFFAALTDAFAGREKALRGVVMATCHAGAAVADMDALPLGTRLALLAPPSKSIEVRQIVRALEEVAKHVPDEALTVDAVVERFLFAAYTGDVVDPVVATVGGEVEAPSVGVREGEVAALTAAEKETVKRRLTALGLRDEGMIKTLTNVLDHPESWRTWNGWGWEAAHLALRTVRSGGKTPCAYLTHYAFGPEAFERGLCLENPVPATPQASGFVYRAPVSSVARSVRGAAP
jgi:hypothetical protein